MALPGTIKFFFPKRTSLGDRSRLKSFIGKIFRMEGKALDGLNYVFCSDMELLKINREFLKHDNFTDIISFDFSDPGDAVRGEIYISVDRVRENAQKLGISLKSELHRVIFHGALHLCGYRDKTKAEKAEMRRVEDLYLSKYQN